MASHEPREPNDRFAEAFSAGDVDGVHFDGAFGNHQRIGNFAVASPRRHRSPRSIDYRASSDPECRSSRTCSQSSRAPGERGSREDRGIIDGHCHCNGRLIVWLAEEFGAWAIAHPSNRSSLGGDDHHTGVA
jgi:hypothetical protein